MQAATLASQRGHEVILYEKDDTLGGQLRISSVAPCKEDGSSAQAHEIYAWQDERKGYFAEAPTDKEILSHNPEVVIAALGSRPSLPYIRGIDLPSVYNVRRVYEGTIDLGMNADIGCETADLLAEKGMGVTIVEALEEALHRMKEIPKQELLKRLRNKNVTILTSTKVMAVGSGKVIVETKDGINKELAADSVIFSTGAVSADSLAEALKGSVEEVYVVGDAKEPGNLVAALRNATEVALAL